MCVCVCAHVYECMIVFMLVRPQRNQVISRARGNT